MIEILAVSTKNIEHITLGWDKLNHLFAFMVLYLLLTLAFPRLSVWSKVVVLFILASQIEFLQILYPPREASMLDIVADMVGVGAGYLFWCTIGVKLLERRDTV
jgi:VanZ family protein